MDDTCTVISPYTFYAGKRENGRFEFIEQLRGDLLDGTPTVMELVNERPVASGDPGTTLEIGQAERNSVAYTSQGGIFVNTNQAVIAPIEVLKGKRGPVVVRVTCDTTDDTRNVMQDFQFETKD